MRTYLALGIGFIIVGLAIAGTLQMKEHSARQADSKTVDRGSGEALPTPNEALSTSTTPPKIPVFSVPPDASQTPQPNPLKCGKHNPRAQQDNSAQAAMSNDSGSDQPIARQALSYVGVDPVAEAIWAQSINDPNTPADIRHDLIEDLADDGFPEKRDVSLDDLPMIENRLAMIESMAPNSMDDINAAAFAEAYKDLTHMYVRVTSQ